VSPDGRRVAVVTKSAKSHLALLDAATGRPAWQVELAGPAAEPGFIDDHQIAVADAATGVVRVYDAGTGTAGREWATGTAGVTTLAAGPGGRIATGDLQAAIKVWDGQTGKLLGTLEGHAGQVMQMAFGPDGRLASVATDFTARVWNTNTGLELLAFPNHPDVPIGVAWSKNGNRLATVCQDGGLRVWQGPTADTASTADGWSVTFADRFDRAAPGEKWKTVAGTWDVHHGALRGHLAPSTIPGASFNIAMANLAGVDLPNRADVRFKFRASRPMAVSVNLADRTGGRVVYSPIVAGPCAMAGSPITLLLQVNFPAGKADQLKTAAIGTGTKVPMDGGRWYACRVLREPERLRMWVDGSEVLTARIPDVDLPKLNLQGAWAGIEDTIEFDDLQVRFPADAARELAVRFEAADLFKEVGVRAEVRRRLAEKAKDHPGDLAAIDRALAGLAEDPAGLEEKSWAVVSRAGGKADDYRLALARAEAAARHTPDDPELLGTLGLAQVRVGDAKAAVATLTKAVGRAREEYGAAWPSHHAALALAYHKLGDRANAKAEALRLWSVMLSDRWANDGVARVLSGEVEEAIGADARPDPAAAALIQQVLQHERDGWLRHDLPAYLKMWAADALERSGRGPEPDVHDVTLTRQQIEVARRVMFRFPTDPAVRTSIEEASATINGDGAEVRCRWATQNGDNYEPLGASYRLVRAAGEWRIAEARSWPLVRSHAGEREVFTPAEWAARDRAADALPQSPDTMARVAALKKASRTAEAERVAREALAGAKADPSLLALHGELAFALGDVPAALAAFDRAERLDPDVELPWYMTRSRVAFRGHGRYGEGGVAYFPTGDRVASAGGDGKVRLWDPNTAAEVKRFDAGEGLAGLAVSADGTRVAAAGKDIHIYDATTGRRVAVGRGHSAAVYRLNFSRDGKRIVSASADGTARVWDAATGKQLVSFAEHGKDVLGAEFSPDGKRVVSCGSDNLARLWAAETGKEIRTFQGHTGPLKRATLSPKGDRLATVAADRTVKIWDVETGKLLRTLTDHTQTVDGAAWSADGKLLATGDWAGVVRVWDAESGAKRFTLRGYPGEVYAVSFRPDGRFLVVAGSGPVIVYDLGPLAAKP
jgi:WD40 repeat protein/Flp pilus assembly protein TadD